MDSQNMYQKIFENCPDSYFLMNIDDAKIIDCNKAAESLLGGTKSDIIGLNPAKLSPEYQPNGQKSSEDIKPRIAKLMQEGHISFEWVHLRLDKSEFWASVSLSITELDGKKVLLAQWRDITDIKLQEEKYKKLFELSEDPMWIIYDFHFIEANNAALDAIGWDKNKPFSPIHPAEVSPEYQIGGIPTEELAKELFGQAIEKGYIRFEWMHKKYNGEEFPVEVSLTKIPYKESFGFLCIWRDITDKKRLENELLNSIKKMKGLYELSPLGIALTNMNGTYLEFNNAFSKICGYDKDELNRLDYWTLTPKKYEADEKKQLELLSTTGFYGPYEKEYIQKDGSLIDIRLNGMIIKDAQNKEYIWSIVEDISDQKKFQQELNEAKIRAEEASQYKSEFLANMSHEIRTPMTGILGFLERLRKGENDPQRLKEFDVIRASGDTLLSIINDILDFSKIESGNLDLESHEMEIYQLLTETSLIFKELLNSKSISFKRDFDDTLPPYILGDAVRLKQVVFNLLSNAIKFTPENGEVTLEVKYKNENRLYLAVSDTGIGISQEKISSIFDAFKQEDSSTTRKFGGTGLGLSISSKLIEKMGGEIKLQSELGKGSKFYFEIPIEIPSTFKDNEEKASMQSGSQIDVNKKLLVVEDNKTNQMLVGFILEELGLTFDVANDGVEAVRMYQASHYDLILMDENMPNMNGIEATRQIRSLAQEKQFPHIPIIAVTANAMSEDRQRFLDAGMDDYLSKPYKENDMIKIISKYLS